MIKFKIKNRTIDKYQKPFIVAELSANHGNSLSIALKSISEAKKNGADAIKIQTYTADSMTLNSRQKIFKIKKGLWKGKYLYDLYKKASTPYKWHKKIFDYCKKNNIICFSTPFDENAVDLLENLNCPVYKIASFEITDLPLIQYVINKRKPIIVSTGMASITEINDVINLFKLNNFKNYMLLHCVSSYPAPTKDIRLQNIEYLKSKYNCEVGLSDHTLGNEIASFSVIKGAPLIEKHFILKRNIKSPDNAFSMLPKELNNLRKLADLAWQINKDINFNLKKSEKENLIFRRSLFFSADLKKGTKLGKKHIIRRRPGFGLPPKFEQKIIGKILNKNVKFAQLIKKKYLVSK
mgnify:CR=1 FL=1|tara:strand:- start:1079 stop:2131 length:1053 start_codon:yes stop_codon:yes gene_type:complete